MNRMLLATASVVISFYMQASVASDDHGWRVPQIEGTWLTEVTLRNCVTGDVAPVPNPIFPAINTFHSGGTLSEHGARFSPATRNSGQGVWRRIGRNLFRSHLVFQRFDVNGFYIGNQDVVRKTTISDDGNSFSATAAVTITDATGVVLTTGCATEEGKRLEP